MLLLPPVKADGASSVCVTSSLAAIKANLTNSVSAVMTTLPVKANYLASSVVLLLPVKTNLASLICVIITN